MRRQSIGRMINVLEEFVECLVKKRKTVKDYVLTCLTCVAALVLSFFVFALLISFSAVAYLSLFGVAVVVYFAWIIIKSFNIEYEYTITNSDMDVDKIIAKRRRKRILSLNLRSIEIMAPLNEKNAREYRIEDVPNKIDASSGSDALRYFIRFSNETMGLTVLRFSPDAKMVAFCKRISPRKVLDA